MKKTFLFTILSILFPFVSIACLPDGINFSTQSEIDNFPIDYPDCTIIKGDVFISGYDITNFQGLSNIVSIQGNLLVQSNDNLIDFSGFVSLQNIEGDLTISNNPIIQNFNGLSQLNEIMGGFYISHNDQLINFSGLDNLTICGESLRISDNYNLTNLTGLEQIEIITGNLIIQENFTISSLNGLNNLQFVEGLGIYENPNLLTLDGLDNLSNIENLFSISNNENIIDISALINVYSSISVIDISNNSSLESLSGINNMNFSESVAFWIYNNPLLSSCNIQSVCNFLVLPEQQAEIHDNATGCDSGYEILENCTVSIEGLNNSDISISPNPAHSFITVNSDIDFLQIKNNLGQIVKEFSGQQSKYQINDLEEGIYFVIIKSSAGRSVQKLIVSK